MIGVTKVRSSQFAHEVVPGLSPKLIGSRPVYSGVKSIFIASNDPHSHLIDLSVLLKGSKSSGLWKIFDIYILELSRETVDRQ